MPKPGQAQDQAMEEILASIRRIIQDEDVRKSSVRAAVTRSDEVEADAPATGSGNVRVLFSEGSAAEPVAEEVKPEVEPAVSGKEDNVVELAIAQAVEAARSEMTAAPVPMRAAPARAEPARRPAAPAPSRAQPLMSPRAEAAAASAFQQLSGGIVAGGARPIDEVVEEMLRPMLRTWLDTNLPPLVERLVREEIERVSRGRR